VGENLVQDRFADVLSVSRLANPAGWVVQLQRADGWPGNVNYFHGESITMEQAVERARKALRRRGGKTQ
jgi:hypothetical protein